MRRIVWIGVVIGVLLLAAYAFAWAFTASEDGGGYFSNGHDAPPPANR